MVTHTNIQYLFAAISLANIRSYLLERGWSIESSGHSDRVLFRQSSGEGEQPSELWMFSTNEHPRFRGRVPNIIFSLSVLEDRPALDIANEMFASKEPEQKPEAPAAATATVATAARPVQRMTLKNVRSAPMRVIHGPTGQALTIRAGDVVELLCDTADSPPLDLEVSEDAIRVRASQGANLKILQGVAHPRLGAQWSAAQIVGEQLQRLVEQTERIDIAKTQNDLRTAVSRVDFELDPIGNVDSGVQNAIRRQAAVLTVALVNQLPKTTATKQAVWDACAKLLYPVHLRLELSQSAIDDLFSLAASDEELGPKKTLEWLKTHTVSVLDHA